MLRKKDLLHKIEIIEKRLEYLEDMQKKRSMKKFEQEEKLKPLTP